MNGSVEKRKATRGDLGTRATSHVAGLGVLTALWVICVLSDSTSAADIEISFPLQGYFHPGRYVPVKVRGSSAGEEGVHVTAPGAIFAAVMPPSTTVPERVA